MSASLPTDISATVQRALAEDIGDGDLTAALVPAAARAHGRVISREEAVLCGTAWFDEVFRQVDGAIAIHWEAGDGETVRRDRLLCRLEGPARGLLTGERSALNFLQTLSGTATLARHYAEAAKGTHTTILDTRKTLPGLRNAQKYAVRCGGANNHRMGLYDGILIKENHIMAAGGIGPAVQAARSKGASVPVEVEVETLDQLQEAIKAGADILLLDNFSHARMREAVKMTAGRAKLEASGGIGVDSIKTVAETGVDYISVGALTKNVRAVDLSMRFELSQV